MPVNSCNENGKPGYRWGNSGKCYVYSPGSEVARKKAKQRAYLQGAAATGGTMKEKELEEMKELEIQIDVDNFVEAAKGN